MHSSNRSVLIGQYDSIQAEMRMIVTQNEHVNPWRLTRDKHVVRHPCSGNSTNYTLGGQCLVAQSVIFKGKRHSRNRVEVSCVNRMKVTPTT